MTLKAFGSSVHTPLAGVPIPSPMEIVDGGPAAVRFAVNWPFESAMTKVCESLPPTWTVPVKISTVGASGGVDGAVTGEGLDPLPLEQAVETNRSTTAILRFISALGDPGEKHQTRQASPLSNKAAIDDTIVRL
jgi:hypothetical protein